MGWRALHHLSCGQVLTRGRLHHRRHLVLVHPLLPVMDGRRGRGGGRSAPCPRRRRGLRAVSGRPRTRTRHRSEGSVLEIPFQRRPRATPRVDATRPTSEVSTSAYERQRRTGYPGAPPWPQAALPRSPSPRTGPAPPPTSSSSPAAMSSPRRDGGPALPTTPDPRARFGSGIARWRVQPHCRQGRVGAPRAP
jgi:hypothetical protein